MLKHGSSGNEKLTVNMTLAAPNTGTLRTLSEMSLSSSEYTEVYF